MAISFAQVSSVSAGWSRVPTWAQLLVVIAAGPGIVLLVLSAVLFLVSLFVLLLLAVPVYRLVAVFSGPTNAANVDVAAQNNFASSLFSSFVSGSGGLNDSPGRKRVSARVTDETTP